MLYLVIFTEKMSHRMFAAGGVYSFLWKPFLLVETFIWCET